MKEVLISFSILLISFSSSSQRTPVANFCGTDKVMELIHSKHTESLNKEDIMPRGDEECYVIPIVFHVYGEVQGGYQVNESIIQGALDLLNEDMHGLNADFDLVHNDFLAIRSTMPDVEFVRAQLDPDGNPTNGIVIHPVASGYGLDGTYDEQIAADAWDNYMYMNIYIMNDLYDDGVTNNSGVAWYPNTWMSDNDLARIVYNGAYLGTNCNDWQPEFASVLTHEVGHWLNLIHTFAGGCTSPNDEVDDTPKCDYFGEAYGCHSNPFIQNPLNCEDDLINAENYMDYSGANGCYSMFTQGQVDRMYDALYHPTRFPLWQTDNLLAVGLEEYCEQPVGVNDQETAQVSIYPSPSNGWINIQVQSTSSSSYSIEILSLTGQVVKTATNLNPSGASRLDLSMLAKGMYYVRIPEIGTTRALVLDF